MGKTGVMCPKCKVLSDQNPCWNCGNEIKYDYRDSKRFKKRMAKLEKKEGDLHTDDKKCL